MLPTSSASPWAGVKMGSRLGWVLGLLAAVFGLAALQALEVLGRAGVGCVCGQQKVHVYTCTKYKSLPAPHVRLQIKQRLLFHDVRRNEDSRKGKNRGGGWQGRPPPHDV